MYRGPHVDDPKKSVTVVLPLDRYQALARLAEQNSYSLPAYIRQVLRNHIQSLGGGAIRPEIPARFHRAGIFMPSPPLEYKFPLDLQPAGRYKLSRQRWDKF